MAEPFPSPLPIELLSLPQRSYSPTRSGRSTTKNSPEASRSSSPVTYFRQEREGLNESNAVELEPVDRGKGAWVFIANAFVLETTIWGYSFTFGIVQVYLSTHTPFETSSIAAISSVGTIALALQYILPVFITLVFRRYPDKVKTFLWTAMVINCGAMLVSSWATSVWQLILLQGVLGGLSGAVLYCPVLLWLNEWFVEKRGMASGIIFGGTGVGGFVFPFMIQSLLSSVGFSWTMRIWALFTFVAYTASIATLRPRLPVVKPTRGEARGGFQRLDLGILKDPVVTIMGVTTFFASLSFFPVSVYISTYTTSLATPFTATVVLAVFNAASVAGQVGVGLISDKVTFDKIIISIGVVCSLTAFFSWGYADTLGKVFAFSILYAIFSPICSVWSAISRHVAGTNSQASSLVVFSFGIYRGVASIIGPIIASSLYRKQDEHDTATWGRYGFRDVQIFVGVMALLAAVGGGGLTVFRNKAKA